jgi:flavodoxin
MEEMMKVLVTYFTKSGNTERLARAIYEGVIEKKASSDMLPLKEVQGLDEYDLIFCGFPVHSSSIPVPVENFIKNVPEDKKIAFFATHGSLRGGPLAITAFHYAISIARKLKVAGTFGCRGAVDPKIIDSLIQNPEHRWWAIEAQSAGGHPDAAELDDAKEFAASMLAKTRRL